MAKVTAHGDKPLYRFTRTTPLEDMQVEIELVITVQGRVLRKHRTHYANRVNKWSTYALLSSGLTDAERIGYVMGLKGQGFEERKV